MSEEVEKQEEAMAEVESILNRMAERIMDDLMFSVDFAIREVALEAMKYDSGDGAMWINVWSETATRRHSEIVKRLTRRLHE